VGSVLCFVLALAAKTQAIIFLPPLLLLWVPLWGRRPKQLLWSMATGTVLAVLVLAPFIWWSQENYLPHIIEINTKASEVYPRLSMNAFNIWYLLTAYASPSSVSDQLPYLGLTYRMWGLLWFFAASAVALFPLLVAVVRGARRRAPASPAPDMALVLLSCGSIPLLFTYFNTQMHERYWHAAILFLAAYGFLRRDYVPYVLVSVAYFLHLESILHYLQLLNYGVLVFHPQFLAALFGIAIILVIFNIYRLAPWRKGQGAVAVPASSAALSQPIAR